MTTHVVQPITAAQRRALFAAARDKGLSTDDLRAMTPKGSISMLTLPEAADLLGRLNKGTTHDRPAPPRARRPRGVIAMHPGSALLQMDSQLCRDLKIHYQWTEGALSRWLAERTLPSGTPADRPVTARDYQERIQLLKGVLKRARAAAAKEEPCPS